MKQNIKYLIGGIAALGVGLLILKTPSSGGNEWGGSGGGASSEDEDQQPEEYKKTAYSSNDDRSQSAQISTQNNYRSQITKAEIQNIQYKKPEYGVDYGHGVEVYTSGIAHGHLPPEFKFRQSGNLKIHKSFDPNVKGDMNYYRSRIISQTKKPRVTFRDAAGRPI